MCNFNNFVIMKSLNNFSKLAIGMLVTASVFTACTKDDDPAEYSIQYLANTANLKNAGAAVDLGLPSGTKWADKNVGAASATDNGVLFIWGDVTGTQALPSGTTYEACPVTSDDLFNKFKGAEQTAYFYDSTEVYNDNYVILNNDSVEVLYKNAEAIFLAEAAKRPGKRLEAAIKAKATNGSDLYVLIDLFGSNDKIKNTPLLRDSLNYRTYKTRVDLQKDIYEGYPVAKAGLASAENTLKEKQEALKKAQETTPKNEIDIDKKTKAVAKAEAALASAQALEKFWSGYVNSTKLYFNNYSIVINQIDSTEQKFVEAKDLSANDADYKKYEYSNLRIQSPKIENGNQTGYNYAKLAYNKEYLGHTYNSIGTNDLIGNPNFDAATANWGADWQMPSEEQLNELITKCEWKFEGNGYKVTGPNGNSIFLPADGYRYGEEWIGKGTAGYYTSGSILSTYQFPSFADQLNGGKGSISNTQEMPSIMIFQHGDYDNSVKMYGNLTTIYGVSIRPVAKKE